MIANLLARFAAVLGILFVFPGNLASAVPIRAHPQNPYILEFRGNPTLLRAFGDSYSAVIDSGFTYLPYLDVLKRDGQNVTRIWTLGFQPDNPSTANNFIQPWPRSTSKGNALDGFGKWDFTLWNEAYFTRLKTFVQAASDRGIVVEVTFFSVFYEDSQWQAGPFHPSNNVQGYGPNNWYDTLRPVNANLYAAQKAAVRRIVNELNAFDNVYYEIENEPFWNQPGASDTPDVTFHNDMLAVIRDEESKLTNRHLVTHNFPQQLAALSTGFDMINEHYPIPVPGATVPGAEALLQNQYSRGKILSLDETDTDTAIQARLEAWMFLVGGGAIYNGLDASDLVYKPNSDLSGDNALGKSVRLGVSNVGVYMERLNLVPLRRNLAWVTGGIPTGATLQASATAGQQYVAYLHHGKKNAADNFQLHYDPIDNANHTVSLRVALDAGNWKAVWTRPSDLVELKTQEFTHTGGNITLAAVTYQADVALRIDRVSATVPTPPAAPTGLRVVP